MNVNITKRKQTEKDVQRIDQKPKELNKTKDKFFSIVEYDLKSPFLGLFGLTELMADRIEVFLSDEFIEQSKSLDESIRNLYKLLENLLEWAQI